MAQWLQLKKITLTGNQYQSGNVSNDTIAPSQEDHADALRVRTRADNQHTPNGASTPSQEDHAEALGCYQSGNVSNDTMAPVLTATSQAEHADRQSEGSKSNRPNGPMVPTQ